MEDVYIYAAALWCEGCAEATRDDLDADRDGSATYRVRFSGYCGMGWDVVTGETRADARAAVARLLRRHRADGGKVALLGSREAPEWETLKPDDCALVPDTCGTLRLYMEPRDTGDSDDYPQGPYPDGGGETDTPAHCDGCHMPLGAPLTSDGVAYVLEHLRDTLREGRASYLAPFPDHAGDGSAYYHGLPMVAVTRDWAEVLTWYGLDDNDSRLVARFLSWTERAIETASAGASGAEA